MINKGLALPYFRVSTEHESQDTSIENQIVLAEKFLAKHPDIISAVPLDTYCERESAKSDLRPKFQELLERAKQGDIRYILIKDLKRLSRSTAVSAQFKAFCKKYNIKLILLDSSQVYDPNAEGNRMLYGFESLINEEVVYRQSNYGRLAHAQKMEAKRLNANNVTFGFKYDYDIKDIVIDEEAANIRREVFDLYVFNNKSDANIASAIAEKYGVNRTAKTIGKWLTDTDSIGVFFMNKKGSELGVGIGEKTRRFENPKEEWVRVDRPDLRIVDQEIYDLAQQIRKSRQVKCIRGDKEFYQSRFRGNHLFSSKVFCGECGRSFVHYWCDKDKTLGAYKDSYDIKKHEISKECRNKDYNKIYEHTLEDITITAINGYIGHFKSCFPMILSALREVIQRSALEDNQANIMKKQLNRLNKEKKQIFDAYIVATGELRNDLNVKYDDICSKISDIESKLESLSGKEVDIVSERMKKISERLDELREVSSLSRNMVDAFINRIEIFCTGKIRVKLNSNHGNVSQSDAIETVVRNNSKVVYNYDTNTYVAQFDDDRVVEGISNISQKVKELTLFDYQLCVRQERQNRRGKSYYMSEPQYTINVEVCMS